MPPQQDKPRVFVDADVLLAAAASPSEHGASLVVLRMAEITLIEAYTSHQVITEVQRNLQAKLPQAWPTLQTIVGRCLRIIEDPPPAEIERYTTLANEKDLPILVAAIRGHCRWLVSFNTRHFQPGHPEVAGADRPRA